MTKNDIGSSKNKYASAGNNDLIDHLFYPFLFRMATYIPASISPNQLTVTAFLFGTLSAISLIFVTSVYGLYLASLGIFIWWLFDGLDGIHARNTRQCSEFGAFLDHFLDTLYGGIFFFAILYHFNLMSPLYIFIVILRLTTQAIFFLSQSHTKVLFLPKLGPSCEAFAAILMLIAVSFFGDNIIKIALLSYLVFLPYSIYSLYKRTYTVIYESE